MPPCDLLIHSASQLLTLAGGPQRGASLGRLGLIEDGALAISDGQIIAAGPSADLREAYQALQLQVELARRRLFVAKAERVDTTQLELEFASKLAALDILAGLVDDAESDTTAGYT